MILAPVEVPMGTAFTVRLKSSISSATAQVGDSFEAELDEPMVVQGKAMFRAGTPVEGRVIAVKRFAAGGTPAYLRLKAASIRWQGKMIPIESSSISAKAGVPGTEQKKSGGASRGFSRAAAASDIRKTVRFSAGRRLTFRLIAPMLPH